jgi:chemotaxis protein histidine kinase CheA
VQATKQQQIMGFFIEEAKEHLDTIEQGLLDLQATLADAEQLNELFRAAHSIKGGAAMLGFDSIHRVAHHLEDYFKILKENSVQPDRQLEDLFLKGFDALKELVEALQSPYGFQEAQAAEIMKASQPIFSNLQSYLNRLIKAGKGAVAQKPVAPNSAKLSAEAPAFIHAVLKKMLQLFKQGDTPVTRQQLTLLCGRLEALSPAAEWRGMLQCAKEAIGNSQNSYSALAPVIIKELKQAGDLLVAGRPGEVIASTSLQKLAGGFNPLPNFPPSPPMPVPLPIQPPIQSVVRPAELSASHSRANQTTIPLEPRAAARVLLDTFNKEQLIELADFIMKAIQ